MLNDLLTKLQVVDNRVLATLREATMGEIRIFLFLGGELLLLIRREEGGVGEVRTSA